MRQLKLKNLFFSLFIFLLISCGRKEQYNIKKTDNLNLLEQEISNLNKNSLVIFDVDRTILNPKDKIYNVKDFSFYKKCRVLRSARSRKDQEFFDSIEIKESLEYLIELKIVDLINQIKEQKAKAIALTFQRTGNYGIIKDATDLTLKRLSRFGIDFSQSFKNTQYLEFNSFKDKKPVFKSGVLQTDYSDKDKVLISFLKKINWFPKKVIFIDDQKRWLVAIAKEMKELNIEFLGLEYKGAEKFLVDLTEKDKKLMLKQLEYLFENKKWLNDEQVKRKRL